MDLCFGAFVGWGIWAYWTIRCRGGLADWRLRVSCVGGVCVCMGVLDGLCIWCNRGLVDWLCW